MCLPLQGWAWSVGVLEVSRPSGRQLGALAGSLLGARDQIASADPQRQGSRGARGGPVSLLTSSSSRTEPGVSSCQVLGTVLGSAGAGINKIPFCSGSTA